MNVRSNLPIKEWIQKEKLLDNGFVYGLITHLDSVSIGILEDEKITVDIDRLIEARFFCRTKELHIFKEDEWNVVLIELEDKEDVFYEEQLLRKPFGEKIKLIHYLGYDIDGQAYIKATCLCDFKK
jgi:hypothetical protein